MTGVSEQPVITQQATVHDQFHPREKSLLKEKTSAFAQKLRDAGYTSMTDDRALEILIEQAENRVDETQAKRTDTASMDDHIRSEAQKYLNSAGASAGTYDDGRGHEIRYFTNTTATGERLTADYSDTTINAVPHVPGVDYITVQGAAFGKNVGLTINILDGTVYVGGGASPNFAGLAPGASAVFGKMVGGPTSLVDRNRDVNGMLAGGSIATTFCSNGLCMGINQSLGALGSGAPTAFEIGIGTPGFGAGLGVSVPVYKRDLK